MIDIDEVTTSVLSTLSYFSDSECETSDSDGAANCPICLLSFTNQDIGTPESCDHEFCLKCIVEWSKVSYRPTSVHKLSKESPKTMKSSY